MESFLFIGPCTYLNGKRLKYPITNLDEAIKYGDLNIIKIIIHKYKVLDVKSNYILLAIRKAIKYGHLEIVKYLLSLQNDPKAIILASYHGHLHIVKYLLPLNDDYDEAFFRACSNGHLHIVKYLVSQGIEIEAKDNYAIRWANANGQFDIVKYLISLDGEDEYLRKTKYLSSRNVETDIEDDHSALKKKAKQFRVKIGIFTLVRKI